MKTITINKNEYKFEFTIEASLCDECVEKATETLFTAFQNTDNDGLKTAIKNITNLPQVATTMFYAGLLEHHALSKEEAKALMRDYLKEHKEDGKGNFFEIIGVMTEIMAEDGFFELIGLPQILNQAVQTMQAELKTKITPQDHKKKTTKATEK